jgi:nicotinamidase-related amidase
MQTASYVTKRSLPAHTARWLQRIREETAPRPNLQLDPSACALLVIDMLHYFADPQGRCFLPAAQVVTPRITALLSAWREQRSLVAFTRHAHEGSQDLGMLGKFFSDYIRAGEPEAEIIGALAPLRGELVFRKTTYDAFWETPLEHELQNGGIRQVLITGCLTHMCCETTARAAFCRGYEVYVAADATASSHEKRHLHSLLAMADSVAVVLSTEEVLAKCQANESS